jgi:SAM-dependent methyltransferase
MTPTSTVDGPPTAGTAHPADPSSAARAATASPPGPSASWKEHAHWRYYSGRPGWIDGTSHFHRTITDLVAPGSTMLELGCGPDGPTSRLLRRLADQPGSRDGRVGRLDGLDVDPDVKNNPHLSAAFVYDGGVWPTPAGAYDAIVSDFVLEHIADPLATFGEVARALRPGGVFIFRTPNLYHYVSLGSRLTPHALHTSMGKWLKGRTAEDHDEYPTYYRANTRSALRAALGGAGLVERRVEMLEKEPSYGFRSRLLFYPFMLYERVVNSTEALAFARICIVGAFAKPG